MTLTLTMSLKFSESPFLHLMCERTELNLGFSGYVSTNSTTQCGLGSVFDELLFFIVVYFYTSQKV